MDHKSMRSPNGKWRKNILSLAHEKKTNNNSCLNEIRISQHLMDVSELYFKIVYLMFALYEVPKSQKCFYFLATAGALLLSPPLFSSSLDLFSFGSFSLDLSFCLSLCNFHSNGSLQIKSRIMR